MKGKFIVIYGANNLGKSLQVELLQKGLKEKGLPAKRIKYPIYELEPTGPIINAVLRKGVKMSEKKLQKLYAKNREDYEPELKRILESGSWIIAEDYLGTGIAWGLVRGVDLLFLEKINKYLYPADFSIMLYGERFRSGKEANHRNENDDTIWKIAAEKHIFLAERYKWHKIHANQEPEKVNQDIMKALKKRGII